MTRETTYESGFKRYIRRTWKNKLCALALIGDGVLATILLKDATLLAFVAPVGMLLLFSGKNLIS